MKTTDVRVRLTQEEKKQLMEYANKLKMSMSDYVKYCCLIKPPVKVIEKESV